MKTSLVIASFALLLPLAMPAAAQPFPSKPIRVIVPFEAGGAMDVVLRVIGKRIADDGGPQIVVENKTGAGGAIGVMAVRDAAPDGYTLAEVSSSTHVLNPHTTATIPYDPVKDFEPIGMLVKVPTLLAVPAGSPAKSFADLLALARSNPNGLSYGSAGIGSAPHITGALLREGDRRAHDPYPLSRHGGGDERRDRWPPRLRVQQHCVARRNRGGQDRQGSGCRRQPAA